MKKAYIFVFGGTSTITLSIFIFVLAPRLEVSSLNKAGLSAQAPYTPLQLEGREVYIENGCVYCHSQQVRDVSAGADKYFGWGRASLPSDYIYDNPHLLGTMRTGPDLSNIGSRQPSREWNLLHLYNPRMLVKWSIMPDFSFWFDVVTADKAPSDKAVALPGQPNHWLMPHKEAEALVAYLLCLKRDRAPFKATEGTK
jgi:cytochrome c oxidase cbb3-type subunit 2